MPTNLSCWRVGPLLALLVSACGGVAETSPRVTIEVAPLELAGVDDACFDLHVRNLDGATLANSALWDTSVVWSKTGLCSTRFGNGRGDLSYVGPCDADGPGQRRVNSVEVHLQSLSSASAAITDFVNPCPPSAHGCVLDVWCSENEDTAVVFDLTVMRSADQGFFDVAVTFEDLFCSAKVDCVDEQSQPLSLLFHPETGLRGPTVVLAFACTAGPGTDTRLYRNPLVVSCGNTSVTLDPTIGPGNAFTMAQPDPDPGDAVWQYAVYAGAEDLTCGAESCAKVYWNVALGLTTSVDDCTVSTRMTASDGPFDDFSTPLHTTYPALTVSVPLTDDDGLICTRHPLMGGNGVAVAYSSPSSPETFATAFDGTTFTRSGATCVEVCEHGACVGGVCECNPGWDGPACTTPVCTSCVNGTCTAPETCECTPGWEGPACTTPVCTSCVNGTCTAPETCECTPGWEGPACDTPICTSCVNGACTGPETCECTPGWDGPACTAPVCASCVNGTCAAPETCECTPGWDGPACTTPVCTSCVNGTCTAPETCECTPGWEGPACNVETPTWTTTGLVLHLDAGLTASYPGSGATWNDLSSELNHSTLVGSPTWSSNPGRISLDGGTQHVRMPQSTDFAFGTGNFSIELWVRVRSWDTGAGLFDRLIFWGDNVYSNSLSWNLEAGTGRVVFRWNDAAITTSSTGLPIDTWVQYAFVRDGNTLRHYRNGVPDGSTTWTLTNVDAAAAFAGYIGRAGHPPGLDNSEVRADFGRVTVHKGHALTATQIAEHFAFYRGRFGL